MQKWNKVNKVKNEMKFFHDNQTFDLVKLFNGKKYLD